MNTNKVSHEEDGEYCCVECALMNTYSFQKTF